MHHFDEMAKALAGGLSRRQALRRAGGGLAGALLASLGLGQAWAGGVTGRRTRMTRAQAGVVTGPTNCADFCKNFLGIAPGNGNAFGKCVSNCSNCLLVGGGLCGASNCCTVGQVCSGGACVTPCGQTGADCTSSAQCCSDTGGCNLGGTCGCLSAGQVCTSSAQCCSDTSGCSDFGFCCMPSGSPCEFLHPEACCTGCCELSAVGPVCC
jgi:hypothetical protein